MNKDKIQAIVARTSEGPMVALFGKNKAARAELAERFGKPTPGGYWVVTPAQAEALNEE